MIFGGSYSLFLLDLYIILLHPVCHLINQRTLILSVSDAATLDVSASRIPSWIPSWPLLWQHREFLSKNLSCQTPDSLWWRIASDSTWIQFLLANSKSHTWLIVQPELWLYGYGSTHFHSFNWWQHIWAFCLGSLIVFHNGTIYYVTL